MSKKITKYDDFINEEFKFNLESFKSLLSKVKKMVSKDQINQFISQNKEEIERVQNILEDEKGNIDYSKAFNFVRENTKNKNG